MRRRLISLLLFAGACSSAADFQDGQAARAVIGQASFSARDQGLTPLSLSLDHGMLYVAETSGHVQAFDVSTIGYAQTSGCPVCIVTPQSVTTQSVFEGVAASAVHGRNIAVADPASHRVLIWRGVSSLQRPDVVLSSFVRPVSVALDSQRLFVGDAGSHHVYIWNSLPADDAKPPDVTLGLSEGVDGPGAETVQTPSALASDGTNLYVADAGARRVLVFSPGDFDMPVVTNAATLAAGPVAPGTLVALDHGTSNANVFLNGSPIRVTDLNKDQMQVQIPYELNNAAAGTLWIEDASARRSRAVPVRFAAASPGIFAFGAKEPRTGLLLHAPGGVPLSPEDPAQPGELLTVWATGLGAVSALANGEGGFETLIPVRAMLSGNALDVVSASLPAEATGVYEVRLRLPSMMPPGATLTLMQNDVKSNAVTFPVR